MSVEALLGNHVFSIRLPKEFDGFERTSTEYTSVHYQAEDKKSTLIASILYALLRCADIFNGENGAIGQNDKVGIVEYHDSKSNQVQTVTYNCISGKFCIQMYHIITLELEKDNGETARYTIRTNSPSTKKFQHLGTILFMAMVPIALREKEFQDNFKIFQNARLANTISSCKEAVYLLCDNLYRRAFLANSLGSIGLPVDVPSNGTIDIFPIEEKEKENLYPCEVLAGDFYTVPVIEKRFFKRNFSVPHEEVIGKYKFSDREFSPNEKLLIPVLKPYYDIPGQIANCCALMKYTTKSYYPVRNFLFRGESGTGKTEACNAIASALNLPSVHMTCHGSMDFGSLLGYYAPFTPKKTTEFEYPVLEDFLYDPAAAHQKLTGNYDSRIEANQAYYELIEKAEERGIKRTSESGKRQFEYIETPLSQAIRNGYVVEIQEAAVLRPDVLIGLNSLLDQCGDVLLENGEIIRRHPDTVIILTTNNDYEGCKKMNQSVLSRCKIVTFPNLTMDDYVERSMKITGCAEKMVLRNMAEAMMKVKKYCHENVITEGSCGWREFLEWVQIYMLCGNVLEAAESSILESVSDDDEVKQAIYDSCLKLYFHESKKKPRAC